MPRLVHTIQAPEGCGLCTMFTDRNGQDFLVIARGDYLQKFVFSQDSASFLEEVETISIRRPISALASVAADDGNRLIVVGGSYVYNVTDGKTTKSTLLVLGGDESDQFVNVGYNYHHFSSVVLPEGKNKMTFLVCITSDGDAYVSSLAHGKRLFSTRSTLGNISIKRVAKLHSSKPEFAVLHTGFDLRYALTYYSVSKKRAFHKTFSFTPFREAPSLLIPLPSGGVLALSNYLAHFCAASSLQEVTASDSFESKYQRGSHMISVDMSNSPFINCQFTTYEAIDENRYLVSTDTGRMAVIYIVCQSSSVLMEVREFQIVDLGMATVATSIARIKDNIFFAASRYSRSILFRVMPKEPHIEILSYMPSSPPVLDLTYSFDTDTMRYSPDIFVCQGGYRSGELRKISHERWKASPVASFEVQDPFTEVVRLSSHISSSGSSTGPVYVGLKRDTQIDKIYKLTHPTGAESKGTLNEIPLKIDGSGVIDAKIDVGRYVVPQISDVTTFKDASGKIKFAKLAPGSIRVFISDGKLVSETPSGTSSYELADSEEFVCVLDVLSLGETPYVLVGFTTSHIQCFKITTSVIKSLWDVTCGRSQEGLRDARFCLNKQGFILLVALDGQGHVHQYLLDDKESSILETTRWVCKSLGPVGMDCDGELVILFDSRKVIGMVPQAKLFLELCDFFHSREQIKSCSVLSGAKRLVGVHQRNGNYSVVHLKNEKDSIDAHFTDKLWTKVLNFKGTHYLVCIKTDVVPSVGSKRRTTLNLIDGRTLKLLHTFPSNDHIYTDICCLSKVHKLGEPIHFVAIQNDGPWDERFPIFSIEDNKIKSIPRVKMSATPKQNMSFSAISFEGRLYAIGSDIITLDLQKTEDGYEWTRTEEERDYPWTGMIQHGTHISGLDNNKFAYLDSFHGVFIKDGNKRPEPLPYDMYDKARYTALCVIPARGKNDQQIVVGDAIGNVKFDKSFDDIELRSQINVLKWVEELGMLLIGTVDGGIYMALAGQSRGVNMFDKITEQKTPQHSAAIRNKSFKHTSFQHIYKESPQDRDLWPTEMVQALLSKPETRKKLIAIDAFCNVSDKGLVEEPTHVEPADVHMAQLIDDI